MEELFNNTYGAEGFPLPSTEAGREHTFGDNMQNNHRITVGQEPIKRRKRCNNEHTEKRKLSVDQCRLLELHFGNEHRLETERKDKLASALGLDPRQVAVWFQNRRVRWKNKKLEDDYAKLKAAYEHDFINNRRLESEVLQLKEMLMKAENEIKRLSERIESTTNNSLSTSHLWSDGLSPSLFL